VFANLERGSSAAATVSAGVFQKQQMQLLFFLSFLWLKNSFGMTKANKERDIW